MVCLWSLSASGRTNLTLLYSRSARIALSCDLAQRPQWPLRVTRLDSRWYRKKSSPRVARFHSDAPLWLVRGARRGLACFARLLDEPWREAETFERNTGQTIQ